MSAPALRATTSRLDLAKYDATLVFMRRVGMHEAKTQLSRLVELAESGEEIVIQRSGRPVARLVAYEQRRPVAEAFGSLRGKVEMAADFDELPAEMLEHFR